MASTSMDESIIRTSCRLCWGRCGIKLRIKEDQIVKVEGDSDDPASHGYICPKGRAIPEILHAPDRLEHPLKKDGKGWNRISWQEAIGEIAEKLKTIKEKYGPQAVAIHMGHAGVMPDLWPLIQRFSNLYGTPNFSFAASQCHLAKVLGNVLTYGFFPVPDFENANCIVIWGSNPPASDPLGARHILKRQKAGARLIVIDPAITTIAKEADIHLRIRPGTDGALALGMLNVILEKSLYDTEFVKKWTIGFDKIKKLAAEFSLKRVQEISWIPADLIEKAAVSYAGTKPGCIIQGNALEQHTNAVQGIRAISILQAITGNLDVRGGALINPPANLKDITLKEKLPPDAKAVGISEHPLFCEITHSAQANLFAETILTGIPYPIKGMIVVGGNPIQTFPNTEKVKKAFKQLEFIAVMDIFMTEMAEMAHIVLPAATLFETNDMRDLGLSEPVPGFVLYDKVIKAPGECWPNWKFWFELARAMDYGEYFPWNDIDDLFDFRLEPTGITIEKLRKSDGNAIVYGSEKYKKYENNGFKTPSGKVEIYAERMKQIGSDPLPRYEEPAESPVSMPDLAGRYPLVLTTGARVPGYIHSRFRNIPSLRERVPEPVVEIHPVTARELNVKNGEQVMVESARGSIKLKAKVSENIIPRTASIPHGWDQANANILTGDTALDPISGFPAFRSLLCRIERVRIGSPE